MYYIRYYIHTTASSTLLLLLLHTTRRSTIDMPNLGYTISFRCSPEEAEDIEFIRSLLLGSQTQAIIEAVKEYARTKKEVSKQIGNVKDALLAIPSEEWDKILAECSLNELEAIEGKGLSARSAWFDKKFPGKQKQSFVEQVAPYVGMDTTTLSEDNGEEVVGEDEVI